MYFSIKEITVHFLYNILTYIAGFHLKIIALFHNKIKLGVQGRSKTFEKLRDSIQENEKTIWFHCASLGEYEQGLPVFQEIKKMYPKHKIVLSFFSPSGFEIRKENSMADLVVYLPLDTKTNARKFLKLIHPDLTVFVKYEIWPNYLKELKLREVKTVLISAIFRKDQSYFKSTGAFMRKSLTAFEHIFVQNNSSKELLNKFDFNNVSISGDTRFDRVSSQLELNNRLDFIETFKQEKLCMVAGSTWPEDEAILVDYINSSTNDLKIIIAPHNIKSQHIKKLKESIHKTSVLFSDYENSDLVNSNVLILDTIGLLSMVYYYSNIAYIGGALGKTGLHNTLEPAVFGVPIIIGSHFNKFPEAIEMIANGGMFTISSIDDFTTILDDFIDNPSKYQGIGNKNAEYIRKNQGAVIQIMDFLRT
jgi:3-deoxy-D-manno-octulosonic-acid transferase